MSDSIVGYQSLFSETDMPQLSKSSRHIANQITSHTYFEPLQRPGQRSTTTFDPKLRFSRNAAVGPNLPIELGWRYQAKALIELFKSISVLGKRPQSRLLVDLTPIQREAAN